MRLKTVSFKLAVIIFITVVAVQILLQTLTALSIIQAEKATLDKNIDIIKSLFISNISLPLYNIDMKQVRTVVDNIFIYDEIIGVEITDELQLKVMRYKDPKTGDETNHIDQKQIYKVFTGTITYNNVNIAHVKIYTTNHFIYKKLFNFSRTTILFIIAFAFFTLLVTLFSIHTLINSPLTTITEKILSVGKGNYTIQSTIETHDEFQDIDQSMTHMATLIKARENDILRSSEEIQNLQLYLSHVIESLPSLIITIDQDYTVTQWNKAAENFTGTEKIKAAGHNCFDLLPLLAQIKNDLQNVIANNISKEFNRETFQEGKTKKYFNIGAYPLFSHSIKGCVIRIDDITEIEMKQIQLQRAQKSDIIGILAGGIAHDFNNILGAITGTLSLIDVKFKKQIYSISEIEDLIDIIKNATHRAIDMVQQLLFLSRKQEIKMALLDINKIVENAVKLCENTFDKGIKIDVTYLDEAAPVTGDDTSLQQVFLNLFINAYHAMSIMRENGEYHGTLYISIKRILADSFFVENHIEAEKIYYINVTVRDTGVGMDTKTIAKIFDPFFTTKKKGKGTGLGLTIVYNIIKQHKGFIDVYSEKEIGTIFNVYIPLSKREHKNRELDNGAAIKTGTGTILVIDDDQYMRNIARLMLEECGYTVIATGIGEHGVHIAQADQQIQLVLLDMNMPEKSGKEILTELLEINPEMKVIIVSGFTEDPRIDESLQLGAKAFIHKPYTLRYLSEAIDKILHQ